jgi:hypothetical protein
MLITEPDVTLTDYGLAIECAILAYLLWRRGDPKQPLRAWFILFFVSVGLASLLGGTVHGFFPEVEATGYRILWPATLLAIGVAALAGWGIGAWLQFPGPAAQRITSAAGLLLAGYAVLVVMVTQTFLAAIVFYLPAAAFLLMVLLLAYRRTRNRQALAGTIGLGLTFVASGVQQSGVGLHPVYFNHNALYHLIQAAALLLIFWSARHFVAARSAP